MKQVGDSSINLKDQEFNEQAFKLFCSKVEKDKNYRPDCTDEQLMSLVMKDDEPINTNGKMALMIQPLPDCNIGRLYMISCTGYGVPFGSGGYLDAWYIEKKVCLLRPNCSAVIYPYIDGKLVNRPIEGILDIYLNKPCLHDGAVEEKLSGVSH